MNLTVLLLLQQMCVLSRYRYLLSKNPAVHPADAGDHPPAAQAAVLRDLLGVLHHGHLFRAAHSDSIANTRAIGAVTGGLLGGPSVGFLVGLTGGLHRYTLGGMTDVACAISTVSEGTVGGIVHSIAMRRGASSCCSIRCSSAAWRWWRKCCRWRSSTAVARPTTKRCSWWSISRCR